MIEIFDDDYYISGLKKKDVKVFENFIGEFSTLIFNYIYRITGNHSDAEEITQDAFIRAYKYSESIKEKSKLKPWLYAIARNTAFSRLKLKKLSTVSIDEIQEPPARVEYNPENIVLEKEIQNQIKLAIDSLSIDLKEVFVLSEYEKFTYSEIAEFLNIPLGTVKSRMYYAVRKLIEFQKEIGEKK